MNAERITNERIDAAYSATVKYIRDLKTCVQIAERIKSELIGAYISTRLNDALTALCPDGYKVRYHKPEKHEYGRWIYIYTPDSGYRLFSCITLGGLDVKRIEAEKIDKFIDDHNQTIARYTAALDAFYDNVAQYNNLVGYFADLQSKIYPVMSQLDTRFSRF